MVWGIADRILPPSHAECLPGKVAAHLLAGAGHMAHMEQAAEANRLIGEIAEG